MKRFRNIDLLRFIFAVLIVIFHIGNSNYTHDLLHHALPGIVHCNICVDFFFIMAGFFLFNTINTAQSTFEFAKKRFLRLAPLIWIFVLISFLSSLIFNTAFSFDKNITKLFLLNNLGFDPGMHVLWFVSVLFWVSLFYFYLEKITDKKYLNLIIWLITVSCFGMHLHYTNFSTGGNTNNICYFINVGVLRGLYGIGIGYFISMIYKIGFLQKCTKFQAYVITTVEAFCLIFLTHYMLSTSKLPGKSGFLYILIFCILFYLFLISKGFLSKFFNNNLSTILGSTSYAIYVMHYIVIPIFDKKIFPHFNNIALITIIEILSCILFGVITHYFIEKPLTQKLAK